MEGGLHGRMIPATGRVSPIRTGPWRAGLDRPGPALPSPAELLQEAGKASVAATDPHPRDPTGSHRRITPLVAVHETTGLQRKVLAATARRRATGVRRNLAGMLRPATRRRVMADRPPQDPTQLRAGASLLRGRLRARASPAEVRAPRVDTRPEPRVLREAIQGEAADAVGNRAGFSMRGISSLPTIR